MKLSKFQAIGWFFNAVDIMAEGSILDQINGMFCFDREIDQLSLGYFAPVHLLCSANWDERLLVAWCLIGSAEREFAKKLVAEGVHNFWPDAGFCDLEWEAQVQARFACLSTHQPSHIEFEFGSSFGLPAKDPLQFAQ
ncbi:hypothetical protein EGJ27_02065 [Pseudomonas sp. v388]|uniref:hypothetical protein n=1 Tax=Pseudomonas sp. v388 TaxID=2479849 RepID=UPI000F781425|nr:hypothetical protein [Pseudomonas sp. v388]RRV10433.1 hypothetical protein EGJ27_02065 [Pseudomonas sp. v388]